MAPFVELGESNPRGDSRVVPGQSVASLVRVGFRVSVVDRERPLLACVARPFPAPSARFRPRDRRRRQRALGTALDSATGIDRRFARRYPKSVAAVVAAPWSVAVGGDFAYPGTTGPKPAGTDILNRYIRRVTIAAQHDDRTARRFNEVVAMVRRPESLLTPKFALRALRASRQGRAPLERSTPVDASARRTSR
jgi:hypothetical protein